MNREYPSKTVGYDGGSRNSSCVEEIPAATGMVEGLQRTCRGPLTVYRFLRVVRYVLDSVNTNTIGGMCRKKHCCAPDVLCVLAISVVCALTDEALGKLID